jgi:hypothetical protein
MDRLIIESTLADVNEIFVADAHGRQSPVLVLSFNSSDTDKVDHAWSALKEQADQHGAELLICKTMVSGIYDLEIKTPGLDEPVRILNKVIGNDSLSKIESMLSGNTQLRLGVHSIDDGNSVELQATHIKECMPRH